MYQEFTPFAELADYIESIWIQESAVSPKALPTTVLPTGRVELVLQYGDLFTQLINGRYELMPRCHVVGQRNQPIMVRATGKTGIVLVRFKPCGAYALFGGALPEISRRIIDISLIWPKTDIDVLVEQLQLAENSDARAGCIQDFITDKLHEPRIDDLCAVAVAKINLGWGSHRISQIANDFGLSRRQFSRRFTRQVGTSPKQLSSVLRSQKAIACLQSGKHAQDVIDLCGYVDQAHMIHNVVTHTNNTPSRIQRQSSQKLQQFFNCTDLTSYCGLTYL